LSFDLQMGEELGPEGEVLPIDGSFPEGEVDELARLESYNKHLYRPNTYLHKWWARRSGTTFRHILKALVTDPARQGYYTPGGLEGTAILDPMMGGGTIVHEAIRLGANVIGVDVDPIPVVQARATLTHLPLSRKRAAFRAFLGELEGALAPLYGTTCPTCGRPAETQFVLYGLRRRCACREVLLVDSLLLRENEGHNVYICPRCREVYTGPSHACRGPEEAPIVVKGARRCERCDAPFEDVLEAPFRERYVPLVVVGHCGEHEQFFKAVEVVDLAGIARAEGLVSGIDLGDEAGFRVPDGPKSRDLLSHHVTSFMQLFTARQLIYLHTAQGLLREQPDEQRLWLALLVSTSLDFNCLLCGYKGAGIRRPGAIRHVFSHHAYSFPYTALENNPVFPGKRSGTLQQLYADRVARAGRWARQPVETLIRDGKASKVTLRGEVDAGLSVADPEALRSGTRRFMVLQQDAGTLALPAGSVNHVVTDPPYYDSVQYSDLSHFFRVWLRTFLPEEADWRYDPLSSAVSEGDAPGDEKYGAVLGRIWRRCHEALDKRRGRLIFTFHHWDPDAWAELTLSLQQARFALVSRWVVFSENPTSVHVRDLKALKHDVVLVLRPRPGGPGSGEAEFGGPGLGEPEPAGWPEPERIDTTESEGFCRACGAALGWFLAARLSEEQVRARWRELIEGG
jgi:putative DNA methylase